MIFCFLYVGRDKDGYCTKNSLGMCNEYGLHSVATLGLLKKFVLIFLIEQKTSDISLFACLGLSSLSRIFHSYGGVASDIFDNGIGHLV